MGDEIKGTATLSIGGVTYPLKGDFEFEPIDEPVPAPAPFPGPYTVTIPLDAVQAKYLRNAMRALQTSPRRIKREKRKLAEYMKKRAAELLRGQVANTENVKAVFITAAREGMARMHPGVVFAWHDFNSDGEPNV